MAVLACEVPNAARGQVRDEVSWNARLAREAPAKWEEYLAAGNDVQGSVSDEFVQLAPAQEMSRGKVECKQRDGSAVIVYQNLEGPNSDGSVEAINPRYAFKLKRKSPDAGWAIADLSADLSAGYPLGLRPPTYRVSNHLLYAALCFSSTEEWLPTMVKDADFIVTRAEPVTSDGAQRVKFQFTHRPKPTAPVKTPRGDIVGWNPVRKGWFVVDPERFWVLCEFSAEVQWKDDTTGTLSGSRTYRQGRGGFPLMERSETQYRGRLKSGAISESKSAYVYDLRHGDVPERDFTLTAFGLPEPPGMPPVARTGSTWWLWFIALAFVALAAGAYLFRRARRRQAGAAQAP